MVEVETRRRQFLREHQVARRRKQRGRRESEDLGVDVGEDLTVSKTNENRMTGPEKFDLDEMEAEVVGVPMEQEEQKAMRDAVREHRQAEGLEEGKRRFIREGGEDEREGQTGDEGSIVMMQDVQLPKNGGQSDEAGHKGGKYRGEDADGLVDGGADASDGGVVATMKQKLEQMHPMGELQARS